MSIAENFELNDEVILKELKLQDQPITTFDISSMITVVEEKDSNPYGVFKCYFNTSTKDFYIAINELTPIKVFTRSILLNLFDFAEKQGARMFYACLRKSVKEIGLVLFNAFIAANFFYFIFQAQYAQSFLFVGFEYDCQENNINLSDTHIILKIGLGKEKEKKPDSDEDLFE